MNGSLYDRRSTNWTDDDCARVKKDIEAEAFELDGCVCPGSDLIDTVAPSNAPVKPTVAPTCSPTLMPTESAAYSLTPGIAILVVVAHMLK